MKKIVYILLILLVPFFIQAEIINLINIPTAHTILRGYYDIDFLTYGRGGITTKICIGLTDRIMLGIIEDVGGAIGNNKADWNIPGVLMKVNIIYPEPDSLGVAVGYDALLSGEYGKVYNNQLTDDVVYGFFAAATRPIDLFNGEQYWHFGARFPILPKGARVGGKNISLYTGLNVLISTEIMLAGEIENIYFNGNNGKPIYNMGVKYNFSEFLSLALNFQYASSREVNSADKPSRSIRIGYQNIFY